MKINVIYPSTEEGKRELQERIDQVHADLIIKKINALDATYEAKSRLLEEVREEFKKKGEKGNELKNCV